MGWDGVRIITFRMLRLQQPPLIRRGYPLAVKWHDVISKNSDRNGGGRCISDSE